MLAPTRARKRIQVRVLRTTGAVHACRRLSAQNWPISLSDVTSEIKKTHFLSLKKGNNRGSFKRIMGENKRI